MKNYYCLLLKFANLILAGVLGLFGISCGQGADEYGTPYATYEVKGKVLETENSDPVPDIQVRVRYNIDLLSGNTSLINRPFYGEDVVYTNQNGEFLSSVQTLSEQEVLIIITGEENIGPFIPDTSTILFKKTPFINGKGWDKGTVTSEITIYLEKKKDE